MSDYRRRSLNIGDIIDAPGAPVGYRYGDTVFCSECGHKSLVFRPRRKLWVCSYVSVDGRKCPYVTGVFVKYGSVNDIKSITTIVDTSFDNGLTERQIAVCRDVVLGVGVVASSDEIDMMCGNSGVGRGKLGKLGNSVYYNTDRMEKYRRQIAVGG